MRIGTRGSELALWQARRVRALLQQAAGIDAELVIIRTAGDTDPDTPLVGMTGKGFFTKEIEDALLSGEIDLAVHSLKDLQSVMPEGLMLGAIPERADRRDVLLIRPEAFTCDSPLRLRPEAKVGTSSARRVAQLRFLRPDLVVESLRGNVPTRVRKLREGLYDAILVASAGLERLGLPLDDFRVYRLPESLVVPAPGQGALGVQIRENDARTRPMVQKVDSGKLREIIDLEREVLRRLEGGCQLALGVSAEKTEQGWRLLTFLGTEQADRPRRVIINSVDSDRVVQTAVSYLKGEPQGQSLTNVSIWITRELERTAAFRDSLAGGRFAVVAVPVLASVPVDDPEKQRATLAQLSTYDWVMFTSQTAVREFKRLMDEHHSDWTGPTRRAAIGKSTAHAMEKAGWKVDFIADVADAGSLAEQFDGENRGQFERLLFPCGQAAGDDLELGLATSGIQFDRMVCYDMVAHPDMSSVIIGLADPAAIVFTSPQAARFLLKERPLSAATLAVSIGPATSEALLSLGCFVVYEALDRSLEGTAEVIDGLFAI